MITSTRPLSHLMARKSSANGSVPPLSIGASIQSGDPDRHQASPAAKALAAVDDDDDFARIVLPLLANRRVLDVGCINHAFFDTTTRRRHSSFFRIEKAAAFVLGIDNVEDSVELARQHGHNIAYGDAETFVAEEPFDVVHGGDIIEHLSNPGLFLRASHANLRDGGRLVLSTPNTFSLATAWQVLRRFTNDPLVHRQHTFYFSPTTLHELVRRHGFELEAFHTIEIGSVGLTRSERNLLAMNKIGTRVLPRFKRTLVGVFRKAPSGTHRCSDLV